MIRVSKMFVATAFLTQLVFTTSSKFGFADNLRADYLIEHTVSNRSSYANLTSSQYVFETTDQKLLYLGCEKTLTGVQLGLWEGSEGAKLPGLSSHKVGEIDYRSMELCNNDAKAAFDLASSPRAKNRETLLQISGGKISATSVLSK